MPEKVKKWHRVASGSDESPKWAQKVQETAKTAEKKPGNGQKVGGRPIENENNLKTAPEESPLPAHEPAEAFPHEGLVRACAHRFLGRGVAMEDLLQEARTAVCVAVQRFDSSRGVSFSTYAVPLVLGALRECCRRASPMYIPRREARQIGRALQEHPGESAGLTPDATAPALMQMLSAYRRMQSLTADPELAALAGEDGFEERVLLRQAVGQLGSPYNRVIALRYLCGLSQRETGRRMGAPQWQVCRWEKLALGMLRQAGEW